MYLRSNTPRRAPALLCSTAVALAMLLGAGATIEATDDHDPAESGRIEHSEPQARLAVVERDSPTIHFIDLDSGDPVGAVELSLEQVVTEGLTTTEDGRFVLVGGTENVDIIDGGAWSTPHGDHSHHYTRPPALVGTVEGPNPTHLVSHGGVTAFYFDGNGVALVVDETQLARGEVEVVDTVDTGAAHHGFVVPVDGGYFATWPHGEEVLMPDHIVLLDEGGEIDAEYECTETHGETLVPGGAAAACSDGVLVVTWHDDHWDGGLIEYPEVDDTDPYGFGDARAWLLDTADGSEWGVSVIGSRHLLVTHFTEATGVAHVMDEVIAIRGVGVHAEGGNAVALTHDGVVRLVDPEDGSVLAEHAAIEPWPAFDEDVPARTITVSGDLAWVVDPDENVIVELDMAADLAETRRFELDFSPDSVRVVGRR